MTVRFGIIGCSKIARRAVISAISDSEDAELGMIGSRSTEKAREFCKEFHCPASGTYDDVLANDEIDAAYISVPISLHEEWTVKAAKAGKHVICEKTSTTSLESAKKMVNTCKKHQVRLMESMMLKYHTQHQIVRSLIEEGLLGDLLTFQGRFGLPFPPDTDVHTQKKLGGGALNMIGCYPIYASRMIFEQEPLSVFARFTLDPRLDIDTRNSIMLMYPDEKVAYISSIMGAYYQSKYSVWGTNARVSMKRAYSVRKHMETRVFLDMDDEVSEIVVDPEEQFISMIDDFCRVVTKKGKNINFENDFLLQAHVMEAVRDSQRENRVVFLNEGMK